MIELYPDRDWYWNSISSNPNLTIKIIEKYYDKDWNWIFTSKNPFTKEKELFELIVNKQRFVQDHLFEKLAMKSCHPDKVKRYLEMEYSIEELDNIM